MITNINYVGRAVEPVGHLPFRSQSPNMYVHKCDKYTVVMFKCGKCRLMGCKSPIQVRVVNDGPVKISITRIQSVSVTFDVGSRLSLSKLGNFCHQESIQYMFEPELFPALRLSQFDPMCVNIFASGKCVIFGLKHLCFRKFIKRIISLINRSDCLYLVNKNAKSIREDDFASTERNTTKTQGLHKVGADGTTYPTAKTTATRQRTKEDEEEEKAQPKKSNDSSSSSSAMDKTLTF